MVRLHAPTSFCRTTGTNTLIQLKLTRALLVKPAGLPPHGLTCHGTGLGTGRVLGNLADSEWWAPPNLAGKVVGVWLKTVPNTPSTRGPSTTSSKPGLGQLEERGTLAWRGSTPRRQLSVGGNAVLDSSGRNLDPPALGLDTPLPSSLDPTALTQLKLTHSLLVKPAWLHPRALLCHGAGLAVAWGQPRALRLGAGALFLLHTPTSLAVPPDPTPYPH